MNEKEDKKLMGSPHSCQMSDNMERGLLGKETRYQMLKNKCCRHRQQGCKIYPSPGRIRRKKYHLWITIKKRGFFQCLAYSN